MKFKNIKLKTKCYLIIKIYLDNPKNYHQKIEKYLQKVERLLLMKINQKMFQLTNLIQVVIMIEIYYLNIKIHKIV